MGGWRTETVQIPTGCCGRLMCRASSGAQAHVFYGAGTSMSMDIAGVQNCDQHFRTILRACAQSKRQTMCAVGRAERCDCFLAVRYSPGCTNKAGAAIRSRRQMCASTMDRLWHLLQHHRLLLALVDDVRVAANRSQCKRVREQLCSHLICICGDIRHRARSETSQCILRLVSTGGVQVSG